ncbi:hypothetical protein ACP70R_026602 [Stipagrostis hirtigluma subsp. patula]
MPMYISGAAAEFKNYTLHRRAVRTATKMATMEKLEQIERALNEIDEMATMEKLAQIQGTVSEIDSRVPDALRIALRLGHRLSPTPAPGEDDDVADFAASLLQPPATGDDVAASLEELDIVPLAPEQDGDHDVRPAEPDDAPPPARLRIRCGSCYVPLHDHDAHFAHADAGVFGVADGVGAYMLLGVDAGAFSRGLMSSALAEAAAAAAEPGTPVCPYTLLEVAYKQTAASGAPGASTAVVLSLAGGEALKWACIGDSGFAVLRGGRVVRRSTPQRHFLSDAPFQLSARPSDSDDVTLARTGEAAARDGDVVVAGTDGLFDNVRDAQLERAVQMGTKLGFSPQNMADIIAGVAYEASRRSLGGKPDDITVVVAFVVKSGS